MQIVEIVCVSVIFVLGLFFAIGAYILQRDRYWRRVWRELGEPQVERVKELKELMKRRPHSTPDGRRDHLTEIAGND